MADLECIDVILAHCIAVFLPLQLDNWIVHFNFFET